MAHLENALQLHRSEEVSETCYPPSLFGKSLPELVWLGPTPGVETQDILDEPDVFDAGEVVEGVGMDGSYQSCRSFLPKVPNCIVPKLTKLILAVLALSEWRVLQFSSIPDEVDAVDVVEGLGVDGLPSGSSSVLGITHISCTLHLAAEIETRILIDRHLQLK